MKELVIACVRVAQKDPHKSVDEQDREYWRWRDVILYNEDVMLEALCFDLSLEPPYKTLFDLLILFGEDDNISLRNAAWAFINDSYLTMLCLMYPSRTIAAGALYAAAKHCAIVFPDDERGSPWWDVVRVDVHEIWKACNYMADVYRGVPSKAGKEGGMYDRIQVTGDDINDKTRAKRPSRKGLSSEEAGNLNGSAISTVGSQGSAGKHANRTVEDQSEVALQPTTNGASHGREESADEDGYGIPRKRRKVHVDAAGNGVAEQPQDKSSLTVSQNGSATLPINQQGTSTQASGTGSNSYEHDKAVYPSSPRLDDGSEEGEVEA